MKNFYRQILKKAYLIVRRYKFLWFFGIFAAIMGNGREIQMLSRASETVPNLPAEINSWGVIFSQLTPFDLIKSFWNLILVAPGRAILFIGIFLLVFLFVIWMIMLSQAVLIYSSERINSNKSVDFRTSFNAVHHKVWDVLVLNILTRAILYIVLGILLLPFIGLIMINNGNAVGLFGIILLSFIVIVPLAMIVNFVLKYAIIYTVIDGHGIWDSFTEAWRLFWKQWLVSIEFAIIMFVLNIVIILGLFVALFFLAVPFLALGVILLNSQFVILANFSILFALLLFIILMVLVSATFAVFQYSAWTLLFFELKKGKAYPKLLRLVARN